MTSAIPVNHHPRHPHAFAPTANPHYTPRSSSSSYYPSSSISTQQSSSYWSTAGSSSASTVASSSPRVNPGLAAAQFVTKHTAGRLHKRSKSGSQTPDEVCEDGMLDEGFFSGPGSPPPNDPLFKVPKPKVKIKPLLKKVAVASRNNSLDLSRSDGGLPGGVGLGIYDSNYDSSGVDEEMLETAFPKHVRRRHARNISNTSGGSVGSPLIATGAIATPVQPFAHPNRQLPRRGVYTPDLSRDVSSNESSDSDDEEKETRRIVLSGSHRGGNGLAGGLTLDTSHSGRSTPMLPNITPSLTDLQSFSRGRTSSQLTSPISPVSPVDIPDSISFVPAAPITLSGSHKKSKTRGRIPSTTKAPSSIREPSPSFAASVTAARLAWEAKEEKKEEKREKKRRRSEAKDEERRNSTSKCDQRGRGNSGSTGQSVGTVWNADEMNEKVSHHHHDDDDDSSDDDEVYGAPPNRRQTTTRGTGRKWGVQTPQPHPPAPPPSQKQQGGLKKRWLGFIVWVRIGMVRLGRKMGF